MLIGVGKERIKETYEQTRSYAETGKLLGISRQRVHQVVANYRNFGIERFNKKERAIFSDRQECEVCQKEKATVIHHRDLNNANDDTANLLPVCKKCHNILHSGRTYVTKNTGQPCKGCNRIFDQEFKHEGKGQCYRCLRGVQPRRKLSEHCVGCGKMFTSEFKHASRDMCGACYQRYLYTSNFNGRRDKHNDYQRNKWQNDSTYRAKRKEASKLYYQTRSKKKKAEKLGLI